MCFVWISEQTAIISIYSIKVSVFITAAESVYCTVRAGSLNRTATVSSLKDKSNIYKGQPSMPRSRFEPAIQVNDRSQTHVLDRAATGIGAM